MVRPAPCLNETFAEPGRSFRARFMFHERMQEFVRDTRTELLRGFEAFSIGHNVRMRKL